MLAVKLVLLLASVHHTALIAAEDVIGNTANIPISIDSTKITLRILDLVFIEFSSYYFIFSPCPEGQGERVGRGVFLVGLRYLLAEYKPKATFIQPYF
jgi:hypothetical protein